MDKYEFFDKISGNIVDTQHYLKDFYLKKKFTLLPKNKILKEIYIFFANFLRKIKALFKFLIYFKFAFKNPKKSKILLYDVTAIGLIKEILPKDEVFILFNRLQHIKFLYLSKNIIINFLKNFFKFSLKMNYLVSVIIEVSPKQIITLIDNSPEFYKISKYFHSKGIKLIAIQLAGRNYINGKKIHDLFIPNYFTIGQAEQYYYRKNLKNILNIQTIGSIQAASAKKYLDNIKSKHNEKFDICLISEPHVDKGEYWGISGVEKKIGLIAEYTLKFCKKHNKKLVFSGKADLNSPYKEAEIIFYKNNIKNFNFNIKFDSKEKFGSYKNIQNSHIVIGGFSTMLREAFLFKKKILCCDFVEINATKFASEGINHLRLCSYENFEKRLLEIFKLDYTDYLNKIDNVDAIYNTKVDTLKFLREKLINV